MAYPKASAKGTMDVTVGLLVLFVLGTSWTCDARELTSTGLSGGESMAFNVSVLLLNQQESEGEVKAPQEVGRKANMCTLCEEFATETLEYLEQEKIQTEIMDTLYKTCSQLRSIEQQCITLVDYYVPLVFEEIGSVQPEDFCEKVSLCEQMVITSQPLSEDKCEICHHAVAEVLLKLKDPETKLEIIEILLKACNAMKKSQVRKCKTLVFEYGPLILTNAEQFLEKTDMCNVIHACDSPSADIKLATPMEETPMLSAL